MSAHQTLQQLFPDAMPDGAFVEQSYSALLRFGMTERNTLACACLCRDELAGPRGQTKGLPKEGKNGQ